MSEDVRDYDAERDRDAVVRIWREIGWIGPDAEKSAEATATLLDACSTRVATIDGSAECAVLHGPGSIRHTTTDLPMSGVLGVTTSPVARQRHFASRLTAMALADAAADGCAVAALGMFDQGFYDRLGFGTGSYEHRVTFDPSTLKVDLPSRSPVRLGIDDASDMHAAMVGRRRGHGGIVLDAPQILEAEFGFIENPFALGFRDEAGRLTHFVMGEARGEHGPNSVYWLGYESNDQLFELLGLLKSLGDQVVAITIEAEPAELQLQDLIDKPFRQRRFPLGEPQPGRHEARAWWQLRVLDVAACVAAHRWPGPEVRFDLVLEDPLAARDDLHWSGAGGEYVVTIGEKSSAEPGRAGDLRVLDASIGAFSRLLFGVRPASSLALTDRLAGPPDLLADLDEALRLPPPRPGWFF